VSVRCTYETKILSIRSRLLYLLKRHPIRSFLVTSPSAIQAVLRALTKRERKVLHVRWITMGPTTAAYLKRKNF
jgi:uroporphyrinogen-III synthase